MILLSRCRWERWSTPLALLIGTALWLAATKVIIAQGLAPEPPHVLASIDEADAGQRANLERVQQLLADQQFEEAVETLRRVMDAETGRLLPLGDAWERAAGFDRWVTVRSGCQWRIANWAATYPAALELYRQRVDPLAQRWYRQGVEQRDRVVLERLVEQLPLSRWGDDALLVLGDWALERADFVAARGAWQRIHPALRTPNVRSAVLRTPPGRPWWIALDSAQFPQPSAAWSQVFDAAVDTSSWLSYPDSDLNLADVRARLVLASILEGAWRRAALELALLRHLHPDARGRLSGRDGRWDDLLTELLARARKWPQASDAAGTAAEWPTFAGSATRSRIAAQGVDPPGRVTWAWPETAAARANQVDAPIQSSRPRPTVEMSSPVVVDGRIVFVAGPRIMAFDLFDGHPAFPVERVGAASEPDAAAPQQQPGEIHHLAVPGIDREDEDAVLGRLSGWATAVGSRVYVIFGGGTFRRAGRGAVQQLPAALVGIDLHAEGKLFLRQSLDGEDWGPDWRWGGAPLADDSTVYAGLQRTDGVRSDVHVAAFDAVSGRLRWRQFVSGSDTQRRGDAVPVWLTLSNDNLYCHSNLGAIACLGTTDGKVRWITRYVRTTDIDTENPASRTRPRFAAVRNPLVLSGDQLFAAPADSPRVFSLDANTGQVLWTTDGQRLADVTSLIGVADDRLLASGDHLYWIDLATGIIQARFPVGNSVSASGQTQPGPRGAGQGLLVGSDVWWPTRDQILVFRRDTAHSAAAGGPLGSRQIDLRIRGAAGGDLAIVADVLLVHGPQGLQVFVGASSADRPLPARAPSATLEPAIPSNSRP